MYFNDPSTVLDHIDGVLQEQRFNREVYRQGKRGSKRAGLELRKATVQIAALGKHFRDLSTTTDQAKRDELGAKFAKKWVERQEKKVVKKPTK